MKLFEISIKEPLLEARGGELYHWITSEKKLQQLVRDDVISGTWEHYFPIEGKLWSGSSFTRNPKLDLMMTTGVRLTLDQAKLAARFKIRPVNGEYVFFGKRFNSFDKTHPRYKEKLANLDRFNDRKMNPEHNFAEEFIVGDIKEAHRYITGFKGRRPSDLQPVGDYAKKYGIKLS